MSTHLVKRVRWALASPLTTLDWTFASDLNCLQHVSFLMEGLTEIRYTPNGVDYELRLAEKITPLKNNELEIRLRRDVQWSDGKPLRASHFILAWQRLLSHARLTENASLLYAIQNARAFVEGKAPLSQVGMRVTSPFTIRLSLNESPSELILNLSHPATWPIAAPASSPWRPGPTLGPYLLETANATQTRYVRNPNYYGTRPALDFIEANVIQNPSTRVQLFLSGEYDFVQEVPSRLVPSLGNPSQLVSLPTNRIGILSFNPTRRLFQESSVRLAFQRALDRTELVSTLPRGTLSASRFTAREGDEPPPSWYPKFNPSYAQKILAPLRFEPFAFRAFDRGALRPYARPTLTYLGLSRELDAETALNLQAQWLKNFDLKIELIPTTPPQRQEAGHENSSALQLQLLPINPASPTTTLSHVIRLFSHSAPKEFRDLSTRLSLAEQSSDWSKRHEQLEALEEEVISTYSLAVPLYRTARNDLIRSNLKNLTASPWAVWKVREMAVE